MLAAPKLGVPPEPLEQLFFAIAAVVSSIAVSRGYAKAHGSKSGE